MFREDEDTPKEASSFKKIIEYGGYQIWRMPNNKYCIIEPGTALKSAKTLKVGLKSASACVKWLDEQ
jgi:hypothetical protein